MPDLNKEKTALKRGMHIWHDENCILEFRGQSTNVRRYWCRTHNQWAYEFTKIVYVFEDDDEDEV